MKTSRSMIAGAAAAALLLGACWNKDPQAQIASAKAYLAKNDAKAAVIEIKSALQTDPELGEARHLLGTVLMSDGNPAAAEVELRKALAANFDAEQVIPQLAKALVAQGQFKKLTDEFGTRRLAGATANADFLTTLSTAWLAQGKAYEAQAALAAALAADPAYAPAQVASARQLAAKGDVAGAMAATERVLAQAPAHADAWKLKGDLLLAADAKSEEALTAYRRAIESDAKFLPAHFALVTALLHRGRLDEAAEQLAQTRKLAAQQVQTRFLEAQLAYYKRDFKAARDIATLLVRVAPNAPGILQLAGAIELQMNALVQAEIYLTRALQGAPGLLPARQMLIATQLRSGQAAKALETLNAAAAKDGSIPPPLYAVAGDVHLLNGNAKKAEEYFTKALKLDPENARTRTAVAMTQLASGQAESALQDLQAIAGSDAGTTADLALISTLLRRQQYDKALTAIDRMGAKQPGKPFAANLRGRVQLAQRDLAGARASFERALTIDPGFYPAVAGLATLDVNDKKPDDARRRFEALLAKDPKNVHALVALAQLAAASKAPADEIGRLLSRAVDANPENPGARALLIDHLLQNKDSKQALTVAQAGVAAAPTSPEMLVALARVQELAGDRNQALASYGKAVSLQPLSPVAHLRLAEAQIRGKDDAAARQSLRKALELKPDLIEAQGTLAALEVRGKAYGEAVRIAKTVQQQQPKSHLGYLLEGDVLWAQSDWPASAAAYQAGLKQAKGATPLAIKLHGALARGGKAGEADRLAAAWQAEHPKDAAFPHYLGDAALARQDHAAAERHYLAVLKLQPASPVALNNLAWVTGKLGKPGAVAYAEKAVELAPGQPEFLDTLATLLADQKAYPRALEVQAKAVALAPTTKAYRMNLARIQIKAGDKERARAELQELAKSAEEPALRQEAEALLKGL